MNIYPIIQWLVKKVIETREETGDLMRLFSESQFDKNFQLPEDFEFEQRKNVRQLKFFKCLKYLRLLVGLLEK